MALTKVTYVDNETLIRAANLNAIQDEIIANGNNIANLQSSKYVKPSTGIPKTDLASAAQTSLDKADTALQARLDATLSTSGAAADAKATGDAVGELKSAVTKLTPAATDADVGKALIVKTVDPITAKPSSYKYGEAGGGGYYTFVPPNLYDKNNKVGTMVINGSSVSNLSNWISLKSGCVYTTDYTSTQFYFFNTNKEYISVQTLISGVNHITASADGYLLIRTKGEDKSFVRGSYLEYDPGVVSRWNGKKWLAIGDSITDISVASKGYPFIVGSHLGMEVTNVGNSGKVMSYFQSLIPGYADDYDLITVLLGTNNQGYNTAIGALNDQYYQDEDYTSNNSFYAQTQRVADLLIAKYPYSTIVFFTPIRRSVSASDGADKTNALGLTTQSYAQAVEAVCDYYSLPCIDLYTHGINPRYDDLREAFFVNGDGTHPNNDGHAKYTSPVICGLLLDIAPFQYAIPKTVVSLSATYDGGDVPAGTDVNDLTDITVIATYSDGTSETVTGYTLSGTIAEGENTVTVTFDGFTTTFTVVGVAVTMDSITAVYNGGTVLVGTDINTLDVTVTAHYSDGTSAVVTGFTLSGTIAAGSNTITVTYDGCTTTFAVTGAVSALIHSYAYNADYSNGLTDSVGDADLAYNKDSGRLTNTADIGAEALSSFSIVWKNLNRTGNYLTQLPGIDTGGITAFNTAPYTNTGKRIRLELRSPSGAVYGDARFVLDVGSSNTVSTNGTAVIANNTTHSMVLTFDASTYTYKVYVDGDLDITYVSDQPCAVDGINIIRAYYLAYMQWGALEVYAGIVDPSNV